MDSDNWSFRNFLFYNFITHGWDNEFLKGGATIIKLNAAVKNVNVWGTLLSHCRKDKNTENIPLNWLISETLLLHYWNAQ
jgi:hypothetical protein